MFCLQSHVRIHAYELSVLPAVLMCTCAAKLGVHSKTLSSMYMDHKAAGHVQLDMSSNAALMGFA